MMSLWPRWRVAISSRARRLASHLARATTARASSRRRQRRATANESVRLKGIGDHSMAVTSTRSSLLGSELEELLRTTPPLATRRHHDLPENQTWLGRAASIVDRWDSSRSAAFAELNRQFHGLNGHEASDAFEQMVVLLRQAEYDLKIRDKAASLDGYRRQLQAHDEIISKAGTQQIALPVSSVLVRLFNAINDLSPGLVQPFSGHAQPAVLRTQISAAIQAISTYLEANSTPTTVGQGDRKSTRLNSS